LVPVEKVPPLLNVIALASAAVKRCAVEADAENVIEPLMLPVAPLLSAIVIAFVVLQFSAEPVGTSRSVPVPPPIVRVTPAAAWRFTVLLFDSRSCPMVWVGTFVTVTVPPPVNCRISSAAGVVRVGVQLVLVAHDAVPV
jgi:hypothetical protein